MPKLFLVTSVLVIVFLALVLILAPAYVDNQLNPVLPESFPVSEESHQLHQSLVVADLHADALLWNRDLLTQNQRGHVDLPRLQQGNVALQIFSTVTQSPRGQNYQSNSSDSPDNITLLAIAQRWPITTWTSRTERALYQAHKLDDFVAASEGSLVLLRNQQDLIRWRERRQRGEPVIAAVLATEGSHALDGQLDNIERLYEAGFRMMSLQHFFDNRLGGSLHGHSNKGLTEFGRQAIELMQKHQIIVDVAHSSEATVRDVLAMSKQPLVVSHSGFYGHCQSDRNISDELMQQIASAGGLIGIGFWDAAICGTGAADIGAAIAYGIKLVGENHIALGSDFDGSVSTGLDSSQLVRITEALRQEGIGDEAIAKVMGGNIIRLISQQLPQAQADQPR